MNPEKELSKLGLRPDKGQNFLTHKATIQALVEAGEVEDQRVLEIGGGLGSITEVLLQKDCDLTVVEKNKVLADYLESNFAEADILNEDVLEMDLDGFDRCVSNIPFQLSSEIIEKLGKEQIQSALIVQEALADKIVAVPGEKSYGYFTVQAQYYFVPVKLRKVNSRWFHPRPEVDAAVIKLYPNKQRHDIEDEEEFLSFVKALHTHGKKKLRNGFVDARNLLGIEKEEARELRDELPNKDKRVRELEISELKQVFQYFQENI
jgi:16S rRNA (adenine1518-N6/adenine1519-N6)-dimethyltransferase